MSKKTTQIIAGIALAWILLSVISTWIMVIFWSSSNNETVTPEELEKVKQIIESQSWQTLSWSTNIEINTKSWSINSEINTNSWINE